MDDVIIKWENGKLMAVNDKDHWFKYLFEARTMTWASIEDMYDYLDYRLRFALYTKYPGYESKPTPTS
jgi:hypothetical protein